MRTFDASDLETAMTDRQSTWIGVALVCLTVGGTTCCQGQRIDDLRADLTRDIDTLRADVIADIDTLRADVIADIDTLRADVREIRQIMISHLDKHQAE